MKRKYDLSQNIPLSPVPAKTGAAKLPDKKKSWLHILFAPFRWTVDSGHIMLAGIVRCFLGILVLIARIFISGITVILKPFFIMNAMDLQIGKLTALYFLITGVCADVLQIRIPDPLPLVGIKARELLPEPGLVFSRLRFGNDPIGIIAFKLLAALILMGLVINLAGVLSNGLLFVIGIALCVLTVCGILRDPKTCLSGLLQRERRLLLSYVFGALCLGEGIAMFIPYVNLIFMKHDPVEDMQKKYDLYVGNCFRP